MRKHLAMAPRHEIDPALLAQAFWGDLTRSNTEAGTPERQAVDRVVYLQRRSARPGLSARQALGHPKTTDQPPLISLFVDDPPRRIILEGIDRRDVRRAARYNALVSNLAQGKIRANAFERRVGSWRPIAGYRFLSDPDAVLAVAESLRASDQEIFVYSSGRST